MKTVTFLACFFIITGKLPAQAPAPDSAGLATGGKPDQALEYYIPALVINKKPDNDRGIASDLLHTGIVYYRTANYAASLALLRKSLNLYRQLEDKGGSAVTYRYLSALYIHAPAAILASAGINPSGRYNQALALQKKGIALAHEIGDVYSESDALGNLSEIYKAKRDFEGALDASQRQVALSMQMQSDFSAKQQVAQAEMDKRTAWSAAEVTRQRFIRKSVMLAALVLLLMVFLGFLLYIRKRQAQERQKEAELQAEMAETEMKALRAQMNPHFIFNSLNSISDYISKHDAVTADYYLTKFSKMIRLILEYSEYREITLAEDLKALELYMQLECTRMNNKFSYEVRIDNNLDPQNTMIPPLILQPFVENSIWHGIANKRGPGKIVIEIKKESDMINCSVEDNGTGLTLQRELLTENKKSLGVQLTRARVAMMNRGRIDPVVTLCDLAEGFRVELKLPLVLNF